MQAYFKDFKVISFYILKYFSLTFHNIFTLVYIFLIFYVSLLAGLIFISYSASCDRPRKKVPNARKLNFTGRVIETEFVYRFTRIIPTFVA